MLVSSGSAMARGTSVAGCSVFSERERGRTACPITPSAALPAGESREKEGRKEGRKAPRRASTGTRGTRPRRILSRYAGSACRNRRWNRTGGAIAPQRGRPSDVGASRSGGDQTKSGRKGENHQHAPPLPDRLPSSRETARRPQRNSREGQNKHHFEPNDIATTSATLHGVPERGSKG